MSGLISLPFLARRKEIRNFPESLLSSVLASAVRYDLLTRNPLVAVQIPHAKVVNKKKQKPHITPEEFAQLVSFVNEPYATMIYVAVFTGLRVSEFEMGGCSRRCDHRRRALLPW